MPEPQLAKICVVEDNPSEQQLLCDILADEGFEVVGAGSGAEGLEKIRTGQFGVAVVDLRLPDFSGNELLEQILDFDESIRVVIYTGAASYDSVKEAINLGAFAYVEKLSDPAELLGHVHRAYRDYIGRYASDLEMAVRQRTEELARSVAELESFASVVAHDLRSPLLTISGYCEILEEEYGPGLEEGVKKYLDEIRGGVRRMDRLIEDLLGYARLGRSGEPFQPVDLSAVVDQAKADLDGPIRGNRAKVEVEPLPTVSGNEPQLVRLFQNLIGNAIKFRREVDPVVRVSCTDRGSVWEFAVEDNGPGIKEEDFERIFQVFQRLQTADDSGTGVGLAVCKKIVERYGGQICLDSEPGQGTTFYFTLPKSGTVNE